MIAVHRDQNFNMYKMIAVARAGVKDPRFGEWNVQESGGRGVEESEKSAFPV